MPLPLRYPVLTLGDELAQLQNLRLDGWDDTNTLRGRAWLDVAPDGVNAEVSVYRDEERTLLVCQGTGAVSSAAPPTRIALAEQNDSGLSGSCVVTDATASAQIVAFLGLCSADDLREADDHLDEFLLQGPPETAWGAVMRDVSRRCYQLAQATYPPSVSITDPLRAYAAAASQEAGRFGLPEQYAEYLWGLALDGTWELVGLANVEDFRPWAVLEGLHLAWRRKSRGAPEQDAVAAVADRYRREADELWKLTPWRVDIDRDLTDEREVHTAPDVWRRG